MPHATSPAPRLGDRRLFPGLDATAYLNHAAVSPLPRPAAERLVAVAEALATRGVDGFVAMRRQVEPVRATLATLLGAEPADLAFVANTSEAVRAVALGMRWRPGDRILLLRGEFPANVTPWQQAARLFDLQVCWRDADTFRTDPDRAFAALEATLRQGVRLCAVSAVQFQTGFRMPLGDIVARCHAHGARVFVDAIQAWGVVPTRLRDEGVDFAGAGGHKWLMGPPGTGVLYVAPDALDALRPAMASWLSHTDPFVFLARGPGELRYDRPIRRRTDFVEAGMPNVAGILALGRAADLLVALGTEAIFAHVQRYLDALEAALTPLGLVSLRASDPAGRSGILALQPPPGTTARQVANGLETHGVRCAAPDGLLRLAPHWPNAEAEVAAVAEAAAQVLADLGVRPGQGTSR
jgi:Selenocysteine lyase